MFNNLYAKHFPPGFTEEDCRSLFSKYGKIKSMLYKSNEKGFFAFICYDDDNLNSREYGCECAEKAVADLHNKDELNGIKLEKQFYV